MLENFAKAIQPENLENQKFDKLEQKDPFKLPDIKDLPALDDKKMVEFKQPDIKDLPPIEPQSKDIPNKNIEGVQFKFLPQTGTWEGDAGNSIWRPNPEITPDPENTKGGNPDGSTWSKILEKFGIEGIKYEDGDPDFSPVSKGDVEIEPFTETRDKNFRQADEKLAEKWTEDGKDGKEWTARDVAEWRKENGCTWHEHQDCKTMQLVPKEIHNNTPHSGGISEIKKQSDSLNS